MNKTTIERHSPPSRERWSNLISRTYFPLTLNYGDQKTDFHGSLKVWRAEGSEFSLSRLCSDSVEYARSETQIAQDRESSFLVTIPQRTSVFFAQHGRTLHCQPGHFIVEQGDAPYRFGYEDPNAMWVFKVPSEAMKHRVRRPERYSQHCFGAERGMGRAFVEFLMICAERANECSLVEKNRLFEQALGMLTLVLEQDERVLNSDQSHLRTAHLMRIERFITSQLGNPDLDPKMVADGCGISLRYLHKLFAETGHTVGEWTRKQRLEAAKRDLCDTACGITVGEIAYRWGFSDQAQFCRAFRSHFGCSATEMRSRQPH
ncbi:AraC family transcriptional regulator [Halomonas beimenensis]|uniref:Transcriptional regulator, AraC family n=1 Tax=Halomonas beimenensis TaxID=475662 RepID=A0A291P3Y3_9GAMM|nr:AraC family transcriptional regulator [Halomonas beimenensis]ATJ81601.1 transcriptional regulator, AraC family [Halomonas beimenensis]